MNSLRCDVCGRALKVGPPNQRRLIERHEGIAFAQCATCGKGKIGTFIRCLEDLTARLRRMESAVQIGAINVGVPE